MLVIPKPQKLKSGMLRDGNALGLLLNYSAQNYALLFQYFSVMLAPVTVPATLCLLFIERFSSSPLIVVCMLPDSEHLYGSDRKTV